MCWTTKLEENTVIRTAEADIPVFKVVTRHHRPFYYKTKSFLDMSRESCQKATFVYKYEEGKTYAPVQCSLEDGDTLLTELRVFPIRICSDVCFTVREGLHSYSPDAVVIGRSENDASHAVLRALPRGADGAVTASECFRLDWFINVYAERMDCVIPKGASYFLNEYGEYVSDRLRVTGFRPLLDPSYEGE